MSESREDNQDTLLVLLSLSRGANSRKKIMKLLLLNPKNCNQIAKELESDWWTVQKHLQILMRENIVKNFNIGRRKLYKLTPKGKKALNELQSTQTRGL